jgi:pimeloyl-ACP methyl ester carboxylesterase
MESLEITTTLGKMSALSAGRGPLVLLLHGFPDTKETWISQIECLAANGFRAVAVSLRGYEPTTIPMDSDFTDVTLARDVINIMDALGETACHLVGHDWGAAIAYRAANLFPDRFTSLTTMAVPHAGRFANTAFFTPKQAMMSWYMLFFQLRGLSDWWVSRNNFQFLRRLWQVWSPAWDFSDGEFKQVSSALSRPGVLAAALSYYRAALGPSAAPLTPSRQAANRYAVPVPTLGLTGAKEGCIDADFFKNSMHASDFPCGLEVHVLPEAGHFLHRERPKEVNELLLYWLQKHPARDT